MHQELQALVKRNFKINQELFRVGEDIAGRFSEALADEAQSTRDKVLRQILGIYDESNNLADAARESLASGLWYGWNDDRPMCHQRRDLQ